MRYLIHSEDCTFDDTTGVYTLIADRRIGNPVSMKIQSFVYQAPTLASYPLAVYVSSSGINDMVAQKHTLKLTTDNHENETDVICVLNESNTAGRYTLTTPRRFPIKQNTYVRNFDFTFTDNNAGIGLASAASTDQTIDDFDLPSDQEKTGKIFRSFDTGGSGGNYGASETLNRIYISESGTNWKLEILAFSSELNYDFLTIVEVDSVGGETTLLDAHSGTSLPAQVVWTATKPKVKFKWNSDTSNHDIGFDIILWEDDGGTNTLTEVDDIYSISIPASATAGKFVCELDIVASH